MKLIGKHFGHGFDSRHLHDIRRYSLTGRVSSGMGVFGFDRVVVGVMEISLSQITGKLTQMFNQPLRMVA
jgi:hypothetical protein